jgi:hypothetical protein
MSGPIAIAVLVGFFAGMMALGRRIPPRSRDDTGARRCDDVWLFPFGRQPTEPIDAERARTGRAF